MFTTTCPTCHGQGSTISKPCEACHGAGQVEKTRKVLVTFPAGIDSGQRLRVPRQGAAGPQGGSPGDLYVDVDVLPDERFERDGVDLLTRVRVSFAEAALGTTVKLDLLDDTELTIDVDAVRCMCSCKSKCPKKSVRRQNLCCANSKRNSLSLPPTNRPSAANHELHQANKKPLACSFRQSNGSTHT